MARKARTEHAEVAPDVFDQAIAQQVQELPPSTDMPEQTVEEPKKLYTNHRSWGHDNVAGVEMNTYASTEHKRFEARLQFRDGDPGDKVRQYMKDNGLHWEKDREPGPNFGKPGAWVLKVPYMGAEARETINRLYAGAIAMIREAKGNGYSR